MEIEDRIVSYIICLMFDTIAIGNNCVISFLKGRACALNQVLIPPRSSLQMLSPASNICLSGPTVYDRSRLILSDPTL